MTTRIEEFGTQDVGELLKFFRKGDRIMLRAFSEDGSRQITRLATVDMDGHAVSSEYGWIQQNHYYDDPDKDYVNVRFDDVNYTWTTNNSSIYVNPSANSFGGGRMLGGFDPKYSNWVLYAEVEAESRILSDSKKTPEQLHPSLAETAAAKAERLRNDEIKAIEAEMEKLQNRLAAVRG